MSDDAEGADLPDVRVDFDDFFELATGHAPFAYQRELGRSTPEVLSVPTGSGKTAGLIVPWLFERRHLGTGPRRLIYALPMRSLVEQTASVAEEIRTRLGLSDVELPISVMMGGVSDRDWAERPESDQLVVGTIDMLLSRALNRGYAEGRFLWPISFGLLNADCRWVFDEVQLMGPALTTSLQLDGLRAALGTCLPCESVWASATVDLDRLATVDRPAVTSVLSLPDEDRTGALAKRLSAIKTLHRHELAHRDEKGSAREIADLVADHHQRGTRTLVVLNRVPRAQGVAKILTRHAWEEPLPSVVPLHSRYRPPDRKTRTDETLGPVPPGGSIVVATQVIEAGVDITSALLLTDAAPFSSMIQRFGRCNRYGESTETRVVWLDRGPLDPSKADQQAAPYPGIDLAAAREKLLELEGRSVSPATLEGSQVVESQAPHTTLRRRDLLDLFDTAPDLSGTDVDVAPFIRADDERTVPVFFRPIQNRSSTEVEKEAAPSRDELVDVPVGELRAMLRRKGAAPAWAFDSVDGRWLRVGAFELVPGRPLMLTSEGGGYDAYGWNPGSRKEVPPMSSQAAPAAELTEGTADDDHASAEAFVTLAEHLERVAGEATKLTDALAPLDGLPQQERAVTAAAALHDIGKAHEVFQEALQMIAKEDGRSDLVGTLLAKSPRRGKGYRRRYFRHELASAVSLIPMEIPSLDDIEDLAIYLVAAHHGRVRASIRPAPDERAPAELGGGRFALGVADGDVWGPVPTPLGELTPDPLDLGTMELGHPNSWVGRVNALRDDPRLGPFRLAYLEAILRIADWRGSA